MYRKRHPILLALRKMKVKEDEMEEREILKK